MNSIQTVDRHVETMFGTNGTQQLFVRTTCSRCEKRWHFSVSSSSSQLRGSRAGREKSGKERSDFTALALSLSLKRKHTYVRVRSVCLAPNKPPRAISWPSCVGRLNYEDRRDAEKEVGHKKNLFVQFYPYFVLSVPYAVRLGQVLQEGNHKRPPRAPTPGLMSTSKCANKSEYGI